MISQDAQQTNISGFRHWVNRWHDEILILLVLGVSGAAIVVGLALLPVAGVYP